VRKIITFIMSILLLLLTGVPCSDDIVSYRAGNNAEAQIYSSTSTEKHDNCSPFCVCGCCKTLSVSSPMKISLAEALLEQHVERLYPNYTEQWYQNNVLDIWQPPKLS